RRRGGPVPERLLEPRLDRAEERAHQPSGALLDPPAAPPPVRPVHDERRARVRRHAEGGQRDGRPRIKRVGQVERGRAQVPDTAERVVWVPPRARRPPPEVGHLDDPYTLAVLLPDAHAVALARRDERHLVAAPHELAGEVIGAHVGATTAHVVIQEEELHPDQPRIRCGIEDIVLLPAPSSPRCPVPQQNTLFSTSTQVKVPIDGRMSTNRKRSLVFCLPGWT